MEERKQTAFGQQTLNIKRRDFLQIDLRQKTERSLVPGRPHETCGHIGRAAEFARAKGNLAVIGARGCQGNRGAQQGDERVLHPRRSVSANQCDGFEALLGVNFVGASWREF